MRSREITDSLPAVPVDWEFVRGRFFIREVDDRSETGSEKLLSLSRDRGVVPRSEIVEGDPRADTLVGYKRVLHGQLVMNKMQAWNGMFGLSSCDGIVSPDYAVFEIDRRRADARFITYALRSTFYTGQFSWRSRGMGTAFLRLHPENLLDTPLPYPPMNQQKELADLLDAETARIDALIEKKRRMIKLVEVRWGSSVRKCLNELAPVMPLKRRWRVIDCKHRTPVYVDDGYPVASPGDISPGRIDLSVCHRFVDHTDFVDLTEGRSPKRGDIIYSRNASAGIAAYVDTDEAFCMGQDVCLITSGDQDQRFLMYALNSIGADQLEPIKIGSTITRINVDQIGKLHVPAPSPDEQRRIADALDANRALVEAARGKLARQIDLLAEHRQALITAAVTGQLDVSKAAV